MFRLFNKLFKFVNEVLHQPQKVLIICLVFVAISLVFEGSLFQLWSLHRDQNSMRNELLETRKFTDQLQMKIERVADPDYLKLEAQNRYDLAGEGDLIFVFTAEAQEISK